MKATEYELAMRALLERQHQQMEHKRIGLDVDGVLASFYEAYEERVVSVTGRNLFTTPASESSLPHDWDWPEAAGYSATEMREVWKSIRADKHFWEDLPPLVGLEELRDVYNRGDADFYFITSRPGLAAKHQTEFWFTDHGIWAPTVLISNRKGFVAKGLNLDVMVEDNLPNAIEVMTFSPATQVYLLARPYNRVANPDAVPHLRVVRSVMEMLELEGLDKEQHAA